MATLYLRIGVWLVVVVGVASGLAQSRPDRLLRSLFPSLRREHARPAPSNQPIVGKDLHGILSPLSPGTTTLDRSESSVGSSGKNSQTVFPQVTVADLQRRGFITVVMPHSPASYFLHGGEQMGFEYELAEEFGRTLGVRVDIMTALPGSDTVSLFHDGKGDILAGLPTTDGMGLGAVLTSQPYFAATAQVITRSDEFAPLTLDQLAGQPVALQTGSAYAYQLQMQMAAQTFLLPPIVPVATGAEGTRETLEAVISGRTAATVLMDPLVRVAQAWYPGRLRTVWTLPQPIRLVWAVRPGQTELLRTINAYLERVSRSGVKKVLIEKYLQPSPSGRMITDIPRGSLSAKKHVSRYDRIIARYAEEAGFDWRFVAALIFEESRFDHSRVSSAGASGLMQLMPFTAELVRVKNTQDPHANIEAGVKYLSFLARQFEDARPSDRLALVLASYVMGLGHVQDAQRIARLLGDDPDCWTESMEQLLPLLEDPKYHSKTLFGYAQGREAVRYANAILRRYEIYTRHIVRDFPVEEVPAVPDTQAASAVAG